MRIAILLFAVKYKLPAMFFNPNARQTQLIQSLENIAHFYLETPEACNLHPSSEVMECNATSHLHLILFQVQSGNNCVLHLLFQTLMGDDQYIFTRLNKIYDAMPTSESLTHKLFPRAPTPFNGEYSSFS